MNIELNEFEEDWTRKAIASAISSLTTADRSRVEMGRKPERTERIAKLKAYLAKLQPAEKRTMVLPPILPGTES